MTIYCDGEVSGGRCESVDRRRTGMVSCLFFLVKFIIETKWSFFGKNPTSIQV